MNNTATSSASDHQDMITPTNGSILTQSQIRQLLTWHHWRFFGKRARTILQRFIEDGGQPKSFQVSEKKVRRGVRGGCEAFGIFCEETRTENRWSMHLSLPDTYVFAIPEFEYAIRCRYRSVLDGDD